MCQTFIFRLTVFITLLAVVCASDDKPSSQSGAVELDASSWPSVDEGTWLIEFYAPWCGHCKNLAPKWDQVASELHSRPGVHVAKVDATVHQDLAQRIGIRGYPTLKLIHGGRMYDYTGKDRELTTLLAWADTFTSSPSTPFKVQPTLADRAWFYAERFATDVYVTVTVRPEMAAALLTMGFLGGILFTLIVMSPARPVQPAKTKKD